jgi:hypothetical protein
MAKVLATLLSSLLPIGAWASSYCHSPKELEKIVITCSENAYYSEAAVKCIKKFKEDVKFATTRLSKKLERNAGKASDAQSKNFETTDEDYQSSAMALGALLLIGQKSLAEVEAYKQEVVFPFELDEAPDPESALRNTKCYQRNQKILDLVASDYRNQIRDLERAQATSLALGKISGFRGDNLEGVTAGAKTNSGLVEFKGKNKRPSGPNNPSVRHSDITGLKENTKKKQP